MGLQDDVAYVGILIGSIFFGKLFRLIPPEEENGVKTFVKRRYRFKKSTNLGENIFPDVSQLLLV